MSITWEYHSKAMQMRFEKEVNKERMVGKLRWILEEPFLRAAINYDERCCFNYARGNKEEYDHMMSAKVLRIRTCSPKL